MGAAVGAAVGAEEEGVAAAVGAAVGAEEEGVAAAGAAASPARARTRPPAGAGSAGSPRRCGRRGGWAPAARARRRGCRCTPRAWPRRTRRRRAGRCVSSGGKAGGSVERPAAGVDGRKNVRVTSRETSEQAGRRAACIGRHRAIRISVRRNADRDRGPFRPLISIDVSTGIRSRFEKRKRHGSHTEPAPSSESSELAESAPMLLHGLRGIR